MHLDITPLQNNAVQNNFLEPLLQLMASFEKMMQDAGLGGLSDAGVAQPKPAAAQPAAAAPPPTGPAATNAPSAPPAPAAGNSTGSQSQDGQALLNGDYFNQSPQSAAAPVLKNVSDDTLMHADGDLLEKMGNQHLKGKGAQGITGGMDDNLAREAGGKPGDIGKNEAVTEKALMIAESDKNVLGSDGKPLPASIRHNGNESGLDKSDKAMNGSDVGFMQNQFKDPNYKLPTQRPADMGMNGNDTEKSGAHKVWDEHKQIFIDLLLAPLAAVPGVGPELDAVAEGAATTANVAKAAVTAGKAAKAASAARRAAAAGRGAGEAGSRQGGSTAGSIMKQLALQTAKQGVKQAGKEGLKQGKDELEQQLNDWVSNWYQNQPQQAQSPDQADQPAPDVPATSNVPIVTTPEIVAKA